MRTSESCADEVRRLLKIALDPQLTEVEDSDYRSDKGYFFSAIEGGKIVVVVQGVAHNQGQAIQATKCHVSMYLLVGVHQCQSLAPLLRTGALILAGQSARNPRVERRDGKYIARMPITLTVVDSLAVHEALIGPTLPEWDQRDHAVANALMEALLGSSLSRRSSPKPRTRTGYWVSGVKLSEEGDWYSTTRGQKAISLQAVDREWSTAIAELRALLVKTAEAIYRSPMLVAMHRAGVLQVEIPTIDVGLSQKKYGEVYAPRVTIVVKVCVYEGIFPLKLRVVRDAEQTTASA